MSLSEIDTLRRLRRSRADRAERALHEARQLQRALLVKIEQANERLALTREQEMQQRAQLLSEHQGQVLSLLALKAWNAEEHTLSADTQRERDCVHDLQGQQEGHVVAIDRAQKHVSQCLRQVEKLHELSALLAQEAP
ncbi:type III secretion protein [Pseudomonas sp. S35]|uniref:YscO family type III secretion system apparatus protein n=1 Tax=Pseudomonas sp. S35 TaxID=1573719 RepID=UPI00132F2F45|nr:YscO family type III secretion system apparatus protein [Pseudomonas sp. S35]QHF42931.1 type III secretion protein [Pseudomonas sp. S35]